MMTPSMSNTINFLFCIAKFRVHVNFKPVAWEGYIKQ
jgi:hypothetical protein